MKKAWEFFKVAFKFWSIYKKNKDVLKALYKNINDVLIMLANVKMMYKAGNLNTAEDVLRFIDVDKIKDMIKTGQEQAGVVERIAAGSVDPPW